MSGTIDQQVAANDAAEAPVELPFKFNLQADDNGISELVFKKDANKIFSVMLFVLGYINESFDVPYPTTGDFIRFLATVADQVKEENDARQKEAVGQQAAE